jgi:hypothetical protein
MEANRLKIAEDIAANNARQNGQENTDHHVTKLAGAALFSLVGETMDE